MKDIAAIRRYVIATIDVAKERNVIDGLYKDMKTFSDFMTSSDELGHFFQNPLIENEIKISLFKKIIPSADITSAGGAIKLLAKNGRISHVGQFAALVIASVEKERGLINALITTPVPVTEGIKKIVKTKLLESHKGKIVLENKVDTSLLGGFIVKIADMEYDGSILGKLNRLKTKFSS